MSTPETTDRPLPSTRMEAAAERLKVEKPKRTKSPSYMVLCAETDEHEGFWALLTPEPIAAPSRKAAITQAVAERGNGKAIGVSERFVVIPADQWVEITRTLKPPAVPYVEEWA